MNKENKLVPQLRFPEFVNEEEWEEKELEDVCEVNPKISKLPEKFVYIDLESVENGTLLQRKIIKKDSAPSRAQRLLKNDDVIFQMVRPYQKNNYYFIKRDNYEYVASTGYAQLRAFESSRYLYQFIHTDKFVANVLEKCTGSNYPAINSSDLSKLKVQIPKPTEQQKIASCLSSLDELIAAESQKLEALKEHKKGLMQNLFPQEGETVPKLRFKEFVNDGDWEESSLKNVFSIFQGFAFSSQDSVPKGIRWLKIADVGFQLMKNDTPAYLPYEYKEQFQKFLVKKGDYVIALTRPILNMKLKIAPVDDIFHDALLNQRVGKIVTTNNSCFVYYLLQN